jgi:hypothetical protein
MADITMCTQTLCPNAGVCYRMQAKPSEWQSMATFDYTIGTNGVLCENYIPMYWVTASDTSVIHSSKPQKP